MSTKLITISGAVVLSLLTGVSVAGDVICKDYDGKNTTVKPKTITIYNNSGVTIYPVLATSQNAVNEWLQGCFRSTDPYPTNFVYKLYVNEDKGIASGESVTITLPLYSKLSDGQYITWWNGGRVVLADRDDRLSNDEDTALSTPEEVTCKGQSNPCMLKTYSSKVQFPENIYAQLSEYTFGDSIVPPKQTLRLLKPENVGYNISYVDHVYLPVAIGTKNNPYIGYSGSAIPLAEFRSHLNSFLNTTLGQGWPVYNLEELKLPGGYNIFAQRSGTLPPSDNVPVKPKDGFPPVLTVLACKDNQCTEEQKKSLHFGESVQRMQNLWANCVNWGSEDISQYRTEVFECPKELKDKMEPVYQFYKKNHEQYVAMRKAEKCNLKIPETPFNYWEAIKHIYGWVPFNEGCGAAANPLAETEIPGWDHAKIQSMYIHDLQYNYNEPEGHNPNYLFNPYVKLIHDKEYLSMDAYGFSVDDAVGFMSELGDGLIFTVGGTHGLENQKQFSYTNGFSVAIGVPKSMVDKASTPLIKKYGVCILKDANDDSPCGQDKQDVIMPDNSQIAGFRIGTVASYPIKVSFTDLDDNVYTFKVFEPFDACDVDPSQCPKNKSDIVKKESCLVVDKNGVKHEKSDDWCTNANPNQQKEKQVTKNFISFPKPVDYKD